MCLCLGATGPTGPPGGEPRLNASVTPGAELGEPWRLAFPATAQRLRRVGRPALPGASATRRVAARLIAPPPAPESAADHHARVAPAPAPLRARKNPGRWGRGRFVCLGPVAGGPRGPDKRTVGVVFAGRCRPAIPLIATLTRGGWGGEGVLTFHRGIAPSTQGAGIGWRGNKGPKGPVLVFPTRSCRGPCRCDLRGPLERR